MLKVYLDLVLLLNFAVDLLLILGTNRLCGFSPGLIRASGGAGLGAVYAAVCLLPGFSFLGSGFWRLVFLALMGIISFGLNESAWKRTGIFVLLSMAMGGMAMGMGKPDIPVLIFSALGVWLLSRIGFGGSVGGKEYIMITAPVTRGNSGGPVFNSEGKLIGVVKGGHSDVNSMNFVIPIKTIIEFLQEAKDKEDCDF